MRLLLLISGSTFAIFCSAPLAAQKKKESKDSAPRVVVSMPLAVETGKTTRLTLRGVKIDDVTEIRLHEPKSTGKIVGKGRKVAVPNNANPVQVGDSEIEVEIALPKEVAGGTVPFALVGPGGESAPHRLIVVDDTPSIVEKEPNDGFRNAQTVRYPCVVHGSIRQAQDVDVFRIDGKKGERLHVEIQANRFGSPVDGALTLYDEAGRIVAANDDALGTTDPVMNFELPKTGSYFLALIDAHDQGGSIFLYRLIMHPAK